MLKKDIWMQWKDQLKKQANKTPKKPMENMYMINLFVYMQHVQRSELDKLCN